MTTRPLRRTQSQRQERTRLTQFVYRVWELELQETYKDRVFPPEEYAGNPDADSLTYEVFATGDELADLSRRVTHTLIEAGLR